MAGHSAAYLQPRVAANFERTETLLLRITSIDSGRPFPRGVSTLFTVRVLDRNEAPVDIYVRHLSCAIS